MINIVKFFSNVQECQFKTGACFSGFEIELKKASLLDVIFVFAKQFREIHRKKLF